MFGMGLIIFTIALALAFDFMNGFHDAANSIATIVSTRVLKPHWAVMWAAFFNFISFLFFGLAVAATVGKGIVNVDVIDPQVIFAALVGALFWNITTWYYGIPSSSSHALIGGLCGAAVMKAGLFSLQLVGLLKVAISIVLSPVVGFGLAFLLMMAVSAVFFRAHPRKVDRVSRKLQFISAALYSLGHGANDAQKTMGIIAVLLFSSGSLGDTFYVPKWVVFACQSAIGLGTLFGGWRIVRTMGLRITKLKPVGGCCAELAGASMLFAATSFGIPVSTTQTITGAIMGVGTANRATAVRWGVARGILWAWVITIPISGFVSAATWYIVNASTTATP